jgi:glycosyltransferase involved in cell wall biosynthesis
LRILAVSHSAVVGPYRRRFELLARRPGVELTLLTPRWWHEANRRVEADEPDGGGYRHLRRQPIAWGLRGAGLRNVCHLYRGVGRLLRAFRPDIVEIWEEPFAAATWHLVAAARGIRPAVKVVFFSAQNVLRWFPPPFGWFESSVLRAADLAFPLTGAVAGVLRRKGFRKPTCVLPLGVDERAFAPSGRQADPDRLVFGFVGKLNAQKGVADLLEAFACLPGLHRLRIVGSGPERAPLCRRIEQLGLGRRVTLEQAVPHARVPAALAKLDCFCMPSRTAGHAPEQFGRAAVEAMSCGLPVIVSDAGQLAETVGRCGFPFPAGDVPQLARALGRIAQSTRLRRSLGADGRRRVLERFTWQAIARRQYEAYCRLLGDAALPPRPPRPRRGRPPQRPVRLEEVLVEV